MANLAAADLRKQTKPSYGLVDLYTYGAPRSGNGNLADNITSQDPPRGRVFRVTHKGDKVPRVPLNVWGFAHPYPQYYIGSDNNAMVQTSDISIFDQCCDNGTDIFILADRIKPIMDLASHNYYFTNISACMSTGLNEPPTNAITLQGATPSEVAADVAALNGTARDQMIDPSDAQPGI